VSLQKLVSSKKATDYLRAHVRKPRIDTTKDIVGPSQTNRYSLVGTAFDYLFRFFLKRLNPGAIERPWVAESVLTNPLSPILENVEYDMDEKRIVAYTETRLTRTIARILERSRREYQRYLSTGKANNDLFSCALTLAQVDQIYRAAYIAEDIGRTDRRDIDDLRRLFSLIDPMLFKAHTTCVLNPTFGSASTLVGGADADVFLDGTLIEVKTVAKLSVERQYLNELVGYYILAQIGGIQELGPHRQIQQLGIYFSRYAELVTYRIDQIVEERDIPELVRWLTETAHAMFDR
jgi:hypothetical protein